MNDPNFGGQILAILSEFFMFMWAEKDASFFTNKSMKNI